MHAPSDISVRSLDFRMSPGAHVMYIPFARVPGILLGIPSCAFDRECQRITGIVLHAQRFQSRVVGRAYTRKGGMLSHTSSQSLREGVVINIPIANPIHYA